MSFEQTIFQVILLLIGIASTIVVAFLFKYVWKPKHELVFEENAVQTIDLLFYHLSFVDSYKTSIFNYLEKQENFDINSTTHLILPECYYKEIFRFRRLILDEIKILSKIQRYSAYITLRQYLAIQRYATSVYSFIIPISNEEFGISINKKSLEFHRYYAKEIIELFNKFVPTRFKDNWEREFQNAGGFALITKPQPEPGDIIGPHHNLHNELLYYDSTFVTIMEEIAEIKKTLKDLKDAQENK